MAEPRRIQFETVKPLAKEKKSRENPLQTHRFTFTLGESNDKTCPEFSYAELVKSARDEKKEPNAEDPYGEDEDDKLKELARKFEEKYGPQVAKKKRKRMGKWEDYIDRGMGYDETDPFIDNDEAYDELVPSTMTTRHGGFYINSGELEFRRVSESDSDSDESKPKKKKRLVDKDVKRRRRLKDGDHVPKKRGRKPLDKSLSALNKAKQRKMQPTVATLIQQRKAQIQLQQEQEQEEQLLKQLQESPLPAPIISSSDENELYMDIDQSQDLNLLNKADFDNINNVIESVIKCSPGPEDVLLDNGQQQNAAPQAPPASQIAPPPMLGGMVGSSDSEEMRMTVPVDTVDAPKLPENLTSDLIELINKIKQIALISEEGKCKFFSDEVNRMLLGVEIKTKELSCTQRSMTYSHLASYLPCTKETLLKRVKKLRVDQEGGKLREPMLKLRQAVMEVMPRMLEKYTQAGGKITASDVGNGEFEEGSPEEANGFNVLKKFEWNDIVRQLLCEVVSIKLKCYEVSKMRAQSAEEYLLQFLEADVKELWPMGWMQGSILYKESRSAHAYLTTKPKKPLLVVKKFMPGVPTSSDLFPSAHEIGERPAVRSEFENLFQDPPKEDDLRDFASSSSRLVIATSPLGPPSGDEPEKDSPGAKFQSPETATSKVEQPTSYPSMEAKAESYEAFEPAPKASVPETKVISMTSPSKRLYEDTAPVVPTQKPLPQTSFAAQMLDKIICASLADFPNSGTAASDTSAGKFAGLESVVLESAKHSLPSSRDDSMMKPPSSRTTENLKSPGSVQQQPYGTVSILKSNYNPPPPQPPAPRRRATVLDHGSSSLLVANVAVKQSGAHVGPASPSAGMMKTSSSTMPYQPYEFQEAFKRSLGLQQGGSAVEVLSRNQPPYAAPQVQSSSRMQVARTKKSHTDESSDEPVNFSNPGQQQTNSSSHYASQELTRFASASLPSGGSYVGTQSAPRRTQHPSSESFPVGFLAEGMKGFPLPIKSGITNMSTPPPAHSYPPAHRTTPNESGLTTSPHRHNSVSPLHSTAGSAAHSPTQGGHSNNGPYPSTTPLSHYSPSPAEISPHNRSLIQGPWRVGSTSPTMGFSAPSQYSNTGSSNVSATSVTYSCGSLQQQQHQLPPASSGHGYHNPPQAGQHKRNIPSPAHQSSPTHPQQQGLGRNSMYGHSFTNAYPTTQPSTGQQHPSQQRIP